MDIGWGRWFFQFFAEEIHISITNRVNRFNIAVAGLHVIIDFKILREQLVSFFYQFVEAVLNVSCHNISLVVSVSHCSKSECARIAGIFVCEPVDSQSCCQRTSSFGIKHLAAT